MSRNPCFSGQCFAINIPPKYNTELYKVAILVLVDSVLQSVSIAVLEITSQESQSLF